MLAYIISLVIGLIILFIVIYFFSKIKSINKNAETVEGIVYENTTENNPNPDNTNSSSYYPIVRFVTKQDQTWITKQADIGFPFGVYKTGDKVEIVYNINKPTEFYIKNKKTKVLLQLMLLVSFTTIIFGAYNLCSMYQILNTHLVQY